MRRARPEVPVVRLSAFSVDEILSFVSAWSPPEVFEPWRKHERWQTWDEYLADWQQIRSEWLSTGCGPQPPFADCVARYRARYGAEALARARYYDIKDAD